MQLWKEYEGRTIEGAFPLKKLLLPEGRSAFFSTSNSSGVPTVIRLIESHFDEEEILARWRGMEALGHPNILKVDQYGQLLLDDTTVVYAVMEPADASLAEVIAGQRLTVAEARQLATSLASALEVLHMHGFVHEHVEPANVFAVGEVVKLRGDCIRETPEGESGLNARRRDAHDLAMVLLQALTQSEKLDVATTARPLPAPFDEIVRNGLSGAWGLGQIKAALDASRPAIPAASASTPAGVATERKDAARPVVEPPSGRDLPPSRPLTELLEMPKPSTQKPGLPDGLQPLARQRRRGRSLPPAIWMAAAGLAALMLFVVIWYGTHLRPAKQNPAAQVNSAGGPATVASDSGPAGTRHADAGPDAKPSTSSPLPAKEKPSPATANPTAGIREQWRVVAYTYNHADQAQRKAEMIAQKHADLRPEVFTPTNHAPYLVTVGGVMSRDQALAFREKARRLGLPRDTYAQNYGSNRR